MANFRKTLVFAAIAFAVTFAVFLPSVKFWFISLDDPDYVIWNEHMRRGLTAENVKWAFTSQGYAANWHPLCWLSLMADVNLVGGHRISDADWSCPWNRVAKGMHLHNVFLHSANAALLFLLMLLLSAKCAVRSAKNHPSSLFPLTTSLILTLLWSLHPLRVEVACWVAERKELLSVFWMLLTLIFYCGADGTLPRLSRRPRRYGWALSLFTYALALLAKPVAVSLPAVIFAWDWVFGGRIRWCRFLPFAALSVFTSIMTLGAQTEAIDCGTNGGVAPRLAAIFGSPLVYIRQTIWPSGLSAAYAVNETINWPLVLAGVALVLAIVVVCILWLVWRIRFSALRIPHSALDYLVFGIAWVYVGLIPMLGIVKVGWQEHSDRYTYWVGCGVCAVVAMILSEKGREWWNALVRWVEKVDQRPFDRVKARRFILCSCFALVAILAVATVQRMEVWRTPIAYVRDAIPKSWNLDFVDLAVVMLKGGDRECVKEAEYWLRQCAVNRPGVASNLKLAKFLIEQKSFPEAESILREVLELDPSNKEAKEMLEGRGKRKEGREKSAECKVRSVEGVE